MQVPHSFLRCATTWKLALLMLFVARAYFCGHAATGKQQALDEWRSLTSTSAPPPRVFVKGDDIRFYFQGKTNVEEFSAHWRRMRVPIEGYKVSSALLRWNQKLPRMPDGERGWAEATVIAGREWRRFSTNLTAVLTPAAPGHGVFYQGFLADHLWYRDTNGAPRFATIGEQPRDVLIDRRVSVEETLEVLAQLVEQHLAQNHPGHSLFLLMAPNAKKFPQPLLLSLKQHHCVWLSPAALYDTTERGLWNSTTV